MPPRAEPEDLVNGYDGLPPKTAAEVSIHVYVFIILL